MKRVLIILIILCFGSAGSAFHIVGGELEFIYLEDGLYRINLIVYIDEVQEGNTNPVNTGPDGSARVSIFSNNSTEEITFWQLPLVDVENVPYTNSACSIEQLVTSRAFYSLDVNLDPANFTDPDGYYLVWERCCRNTTIKNILNPEGAGMTYVVDIPPLMKNEEVFVNSSPSLFKPLSDYACINQLYYVEFTGIDYDGDSLVYSLVAPLNNSSSQDPSPPASPKPHFEVTFKEGYSVENMIPGNPPLKISNRGLLTVTPTETGLFVFSVLVEEYRDGEKIGQTRRDFQMLAIDDCNPPDPPQVEVEIPEDPDFDPFVDVLTYTVYDSACFNFKVANVTDGETISLRAEGVNFDGDLDEIFQINQLPVGESDDELLIEVCIPDCPPVRDGPFILDLIASDDACPLPQLDTVRMYIQVEPPPNEFPEVLPVNNFIVHVDSLAVQSFSATDIDNDAMVVELLVDGNDDPEALGFFIEIDSANSSKGRIQGSIIWDTNCTSSDFSGQQDFHLYLKVEDRDTCSVPTDELMPFSARVILPENNAPVVSAENSSLDREIKVELGSQLIFDVEVNDPDEEDTLGLWFIGAGFNENDYDIVFEEVSGKSNISSKFIWNLQCNASLFEDGKTFELWFIADDQDKCKIQNFDTLRYTVTVDYPENQKPVIEELNRTITIGVNETIRLPIRAFDSDNDEITISFAEGILPPASETLFFESKTGRGSVVSTLEWTPECSLLRSGETETTQQIIIQAKDQACPNPTIDTVKLNFRIVDDADRQADFLPPNVFTPNGDGVNDVFRLSGNFDPAQNLPADNCDNFFEYIVINNRSGNEVFRSENRDFTWTGDRLPPGVYYYLIRYSRSELKGYIHLIR